jgi:hypothetical protein
MNLKKNERYLRVNLLGPRPSSYKKEFTDPRSHKVEKHCYRKLWKEVIVRNSRRYFQVVDV